jgi:hypothetical protein
MSGTPSSPASASVDWLAIIALIAGVVSLFVNPYLLVSAVAIVLAIVALVRGRSGAGRTYRIVAIVALAIAIGGVVLTLISNTINAAL